MTTIRLLLATVVPQAPFGTMADEAAPGPTVCVAGVVLKWVCGDREANFQRFEQHSAKLPSAGPRSSEKPSNLLFGVFQLATCSPFRIANSALAVAALRRFCGRQFPSVRSGVN